MTELKIAIDNVYMYILVFIRLAAMIGFNPVLSRNNIPAMTRTGLVFCATLLLTPFVPIPEGYENNAVDLVLCIIREIAVGWCLSYVFNIYFYFLTFIGDVLDMQFGLSMAKVMDPGTNIQSAFTGQFINLIFMAYVFVTNSHLTMIKIIVDSYELIPAGAAGINIEAVSTYCIGVFITAFTLVIRLAFPFIAMEFILEMGMGILMKLIPQIHVFVINVQFKLLLAIFMLFVMAIPITQFTENYILAILENMKNVLQTLAQ